jgi:hypothetical protein
MKHKIADTLEDIVAEVEPRLRSMADEQAATPLRVNGWSAKEVVGHLIDSASNNHQRFVRMQQAPHIQLAGYDQEHWVRWQAYADEDWPALISLWASYNRHLAHIIRQIQPAALANRCEIGPGRELTLDHLVDDYLGHLEHHLRQIGVYRMTTVPYPLRG